ncbi:MAG: hypothetical protein V7642_517 [Burkholderiales bacterium]
MHSLSVIRNVAMEALDDSEDDNPEALSMFHEIADPRIVLELLELAETSLASDEMKALGQLLGDMASYIEKVPDVNGAAKPLQRDELLLRYKQLGKLSGLIGQQ